jgi:hypothetical protein
MHGFNNTKYNHTIHTTHTTQQRGDDIESKW